MRAPAGSGALPPPELDVQLASDVLVRHDGLVLIGGSPVRLVRLSPAGAHVVERWRAAPASAGHTVGERALARRLLDAGLLTPVPRPLPSIAHVEIVVPAFNEPERLARCLTALAATELPVTVVDDGSADAGAIARVASEHGARVVRHDVNQGPAAARNTGLAATEADLILFVDSDVVAEANSAWLRTLVAHFADPAVGAVAPRIHPLGDSHGLLAGYESRHSSLDMGVRGGAVAPGRWTSYVPSTTLLVRRSAVPDGGFDPSMLVGEDVDFVWRLCASGWRVIYDPRAGVRHDHRLAPGAFVARRRDYAMSIAPLAKRHPAAVPALQADFGTLALLALLTAGRMRPALALLVLRAFRLRRQLGGRTAEPSRLALELTARGVLGTARGASHAIRRAWSPALLVLGLRRRRAATVFAVAELARLRPGHPADLPIGVVDDLIAAAGTWEACIRQRTLKPLLPRHRSLSER